MTALALTGGRPTGTFEISNWPRPTPQTHYAVREVLNSGRWSAPPDGPDRDTSAEARFAAGFARFLDVAHCVTTTNGSSALIAALEGMDVGPGDEVIVPGLTWVANATTVLAVNGVPVMVDVDPATLCLDPAALEAAVTARTKAIVVVHLYNSIADLTAISSIARRHGIAVIEDCSHAHGASWNGRRVGGWGDAGVFSMQAKKLLTAGEGGAVVCDDEDLYDRLFQLHADGRRPFRRADGAGGADPAHCTVSGTNFRMSEICAAMLSAQLDDLASLNLRRARQADRVDGLLGQVSGVMPIAALPSVTERTHYYYTARIERAMFGGVTAETICRALSAETGIPFQPAYPPLYRHPLYRPHGKRRFQAAGSDAALLDGPAGGLREAERAGREVITFHHAALLTPDWAFDHLPAAIEKLQRHAAELRALERR